MATEKEHLERLIFEVFGAEEGAKKIDKLRAAEEKHAKSLKGLKKQARETAREEAKAAREREQALDKLKVKYAAVAAAVGVYVAAGAEMVATYARMNAEEGKLRFALAKTTDVAHARNAAFAEAEKSMKAWERFGVSAEEQTKALTMLVSESKNYGQSLEDLRLSIDIQAATEWDLQRAAEAVRKVRQGEVEVLKELGVVSKDHAEDLGKIKDKTKRTAESVKLLTQHFKGGAEGTVGLEEAISATENKLKDTKKILGEAIVEFGKLAQKIGESVGLLDEGEHPIDELNGRLQTLLDLGKSGDWKTIAGILMLINPATTAAGASLLGYASTDVQPDLKAATDAALAQAGTLRAMQGIKVDEVPDFVAPPSKKKPKKSGGTRKRKDGSEATAYGTEEFDETYAAIWENTYQRDVDAFQEAWDEKNRITDEALAFQEESARNLEDLMKDVPDVIGFDEAEAKKQKQFQQDMARQAVQTAGAVADAVVEGEVAKAAVKTAMAAGEALLLAAFGDARGAAFAGLAAAQFGLVGGIAAAQQGSKVKGKGASSSALASDRDRLSLASEENRSREARAPKTNIINIHSTFGPSDDDARRLADTVEREMRNRT